MTTLDGFVQFFDPQDETTITERRLPHWSQAGTVCFLTWRTHDSLPSIILDTWFNERAAWLLQRGINPTDADWRSALSKLGNKLVRQFMDAFWNRWHDALDESYGGCVLKEQQIAAEVAKSLHHLDGQRYILYDFVVMPNHVHILAAFLHQDAMLAQCESWKHFTAREINKRLGRKGRFWQQDSFDHLVRSEEQFQFLRRYIAENPKRAKLRDGESLHFSKEPS